MKLNNQTNLKNFSKLFFNKINSLENQDAKTKIFSSFWAVLIGILISMIAIRIFGYNPLYVFKTIIFDVSFAKNQVKNLLLIITVFILGGIAVAINFKAGFFNIGVPGQMMASGLTSLLIVLNLDSSIHTKLFLGFLAAIVSSVLVSLLVGVLKAYFKVNEVISTILVNWIVFYICQFMLRARNLNIIFRSQNSPDTTVSVLEKGFANTFYDTQGFAWIIFSLVIVFAILMWIVFQKTTIGLKIKIIGQNQNAAIYSGINSKKTIILTFLFSSVLTSIAGFLWYIFKEKGLSLGNGPLPEGFNTILISLLAFNSPLGIIFSSFFYSIISLGSGGLQAYGIQLDNQTTQIIVGIIIYLTAISVVFIKFKPLQYLKNIFFLIKSKKYFGISINKTSNYNKDRENVFSQSQNKQELKELKITKIENYINSIIEFINQKQAYLLQSYIKLQFAELKLFILKRQIIALKNKSQKATQKQILSNIKRNFGIKPPSKTDSVDIKLKYFEQISQKKHEAHMELIQLGYFERKNHLKLFVQKVSENRKLFKSIRNELIIKYSTRIRG